MTFLTRGSAALFIPITVLVAFLSLLNCRADLLLSETFGYTNGPLTTVSAGLWATHSGAGEDLLIVNGRAVLSSVQTQDVNVVIPGGPFPSSTNASLYWGFRLTVTDLPLNGGGYFAHLNTTSSRSRVFITTNSAAPGRFRLGLANASSAADAIVPVDLPTFTEHVVIVKFTPATGMSTAWINPDQETDASTSATDSATAVTASRVALRQSTGIGTLAVDDLKIGTAWADVFATSQPVPPSITLQPVDQRAKEGQRVTFSTVVQGSMPISLQWFWNGAALPGATNGSLILNAISLTNSGAYVLMASNVADKVFGRTATLTVNPQRPLDDLLRIVTYNVKGNGVTNWSVNSPQVQAICRKLSYLSPDVITFNEIPVNFTYELTNWVAAYLPGYNLATNSGSDGFIRTVIASRHRILSSSKHLDGVSLAPYGTGNFARDLFHARIQVPGYIQPLDVFTTHLKATTSGGQTDADKRAAEAKAVSNYIANVYLPTNNGALYVLTGDLNEDVVRPDSERYQTGFPIQNLANPQTGLMVTTPVNPVTGQEFTLSIAGPLNVRFDYVMPCQTLYSNIVTSQVFRTDVLTNAAVPDFQLSDSRSASDHLPVMITFRNPYPPLQKIVRAGDVTTLSWESVPGRKFSIKASSDLSLPASTWSVLAEPFTAVAFRSSLSVTSAAPSQFFKIEPLAP